MGKVEIGIYFCVTADILTNVLQKCSWSSPLQIIWFLSKSLILIGCHGNLNVKFSEKIFKNLLLRRHTGDEAETLHKCLCYYPLHKLCFYCCCACGFVAIATLSSHRFIKGSVWGRMWNSTVSVPDHCLFIYFTVITYPENATLKCF